MKKVIINPITVDYGTMCRTSAQPGQNASQIISTSTVVRGDKAGLLLHDLEPQLETSEPLPQFSRNAAYGHSRFENARKKAEASATSEEGA